jgi:cytoskeletal protein CcmA (bactofilin family)
MSELSLSLLSTTEYQRIVNASPNGFHSPADCWKLEEIVRKLGENPRAGSKPERKIFERWKNSNFSIVIPSGEEVEGPWDRKGKVKIEGIFRGDLRSRDEIIVAQSGLAIGDFCAPSLICTGTIEGNILANGKVLLSTGAHMVGKISAPSIIIQEGAKFDGICKILSDKKSSPFSWKN